jgi:DNA-binding GntR family transcriptional regulator
MTKPNTLFKQAYNGCLQRIEVEHALPSEAQLAAGLAVSRTTVRSVLTLLADRGLIRWEQRCKRVLRLPRAEDFFPAGEIDPVAVVIERKVMRRILAEDGVPGGSINEAELAREIGVSTSSVREFLIRFSRFGLIEKRPNSTWILKGFTRDFALELTEVREMFELRSAQAFVRLSAAHSAWQELGQIESQHRDALAAGRLDEPDFCELDERFHRLIHAVSNNRFVVDFYDVIALIFHHHYRWRKPGASARNRIAAEEHLDYIGALKSGDPRAVDAACRAHLRSARDSLLESIILAD